MKQNKFIMILSLPLLIISLGGCNQQGNTPGEDPFDDKSEKYYENVEKRNQFNKDSELNFDDEITFGLDDKVWNTLDGYWENGGTTPHNGVRRRNLFYTKDSTGNGYLAMKARGLYNREDENTKGLPEGACIETKNSLGPGRYEVYMAAMPREGGVSALWTYKCESSENVSQNEIDIEIGGGAQYSNMWCTTWTTKTNKATNAPSVEKYCHMNDGQIHKYTFDWYTDYGTTGEGRVDWFVDGHFIQSLSGGTVTNIDMPLWLGLWMPSWAGEASWVEDYMLIDRVSYTAFDENQYYETKRAYNTYSPKDPSKSEIAEVDFDAITSKLNLFSNPGFEIRESYQTDDYYGWRAFRDFKGNATFTTNTDFGNYAFKVKGNSSVTNGEAYYYQRISSLYPGYRFNFEIMAWTDTWDDEAEIIIWQKKNGSVTISKEEIPFGSTVPTKYEKNITITEGADCLDIFLHVKNGTAYFDEAKLYRQ